jgi:exopolysaccharide biosynthesis protein
MLVKKGKPFVTKAEEQFPSDISQGRAPRTGVAVLPNRHALLAVVDGRQEASIGATLEEFAELLVKFGAKEAVNFDGGGSSAMVIGGELVNSPSDGEERRVGSALAVMTRKEEPSGKKPRKK